MSIDQALMLIPTDYRLDTIDASILGRYRVMIKLTGNAYDDWHLSDECLAVSGNDVRQKLYVSGVSANLADAILAAIEEISS